MSTVFDDDVTVTMRGVSDDSGLPYTVNAMVLAGDEVLLELKEGPPGPPGVEGEPSWPWVWMGDVADQATLDAMPLTVDDAGKAWRVVASNEIRYWTGSMQIAFEDAFMAPGNAGVPNVLTGDAITGAVGSSASAAFTGAPPNQVLTITGPRGVTGPQGDPGVPGKIMDCPDVDDTVTRGQDTVLAWDAAQSKYKLIGSPGMRGPWGIAGRQITSASNSNLSPRTVASITIPAQPFAWRPFILGGMTVQPNVSVVGATRVDLEVRMNAVDGPLVAYGVGFPSANYFVVKLFPRFDTVVSPASTVGVVPANQTTVFYFNSRRVVGVDNYTLNSDLGHLVVHAIPVYP